MHLHTLLIKSFRNFDEECFHFSPKTTFIIGENGKGKTSILEAIHVLMTGGSFRTAHIKDLIKKGANGFYLECRFQKHSVEQVIKFRYDAKLRHIFYNSTPYHQSSSLLGIIQGVITTPDDIQLIKGPPELRRRFLDFQIAQSDPLFIHHLLRYQRALKQRNTLLKNKQLRGIEGFEHEMALSAAHITKKRLETLMHIERLSIENHVQANERISLLWPENSPFTYEDYQKKFAILRSREVIAQHSLIGPHRDDFEIQLNHLPAKGYASEGQQRSIVGTLRLAEWGLLKERSNETPLYLIDDIGISLDTRRKSRLYSQLNQFGQVLATTTELSEEHTPLFHHFAI